ncbi:MAG: SOS response-associated peptidase [Desulfomonilaceae bacterium]|nr:SOS response-associated peptidase [Desulfomonilaceae bacterium]
MCGRFLLMAAGRDLARRFGLLEEPDLKPRNNIAPTQMVAVIRAEPDTLERHLDMLKWGLIPFWAKDPSIGSRMINARAETVAEKPAFRAAFKHRRCIIPADGFYEWTKEKGKKQPYLVAPADGATFAMAGLWEHWKDKEGNVIESCTILTTEANEAVQKLHDRMPVILRPDDYDTWLNPGLGDPRILKPMLIAYPSDAMTLSRASPEINKPGPA